MAPEDNPIDERHMTKEEYEQWEKEQDEKSKALPTPPIMTEEEKKAVEKAARDGFYGKPVEKK